MKTILLPLLMLGAGLAAAQDGDEARGHAFAQRVCAECHAVGRGELVSPNPRSPSFEDIAHTPGMTGMALAVALQTSHENMPNLVLSQQERHDVIAYILSLQR